LIRLPYKSKFWCLYFTKKLLCIHVEPRLFTLQYINVNINSSFLDTELSQHENLKQICNLKVTAAEKDDVRRN